MLTALSSYQLKDNAQKLSVYRVYFVPDVFIDYTQRQPLYA